MTLSKVIVLFSMLLGLPAFGATEQRCSSKITPFTAQVSWYDDTKVEKFLHVRATSACSRYDLNVFKLSDAYVSIRLKDGTLVEEIGSADGVFDQNHQRVYLMGLENARKVFPNKTDSNIKSEEQTLLIDVITNEVRGPNGTYFKID